MERENLKIELTKFCSKEKNISDLCDKTQFQQKQGLINYVGAYFLDIYSDKKGNIQYFVADEVLYDSKDMLDEAGKDKNKVKQLVIK